MRHFAVRFLPAVLILSTLWTCSDLGEEPEREEEMHESVEIVSVRDNTLYQEDGGLLSNGGGEHFFAGNTNDGLIRRGLVAFDVAGSVPEGATIDSVTLALNMSRSQVGSEPVELHRVLSDWGEGTSDAPFNEGAGTQSTEGDATWIHTFYDTSFWTNAGGDFSATISASEPVAGIGVYTWGSTPEMVADVQSWLDSPSENYGWILVGNEAGTQTTKRFDSRENTVEANRPLLKAYYTVTE